MITSLEKQRKHFMDFGSMNFAMFTLNLLKTFYQIRMKMRL